MAKPKPTVSKNDNKALELLLGAFVKSNPQPELVAAYKELTGKSLDVKAGEAGKAKKKVGRPKKSRIIVPDEEFEPSDQVSEVIEDNDDEYKEENEHKKECRPAPIGKKPMRFTDCKGVSLTTDERKELAAAAKAQKALGVFHRASPGRPPAEKVKVICKKCHRKLKVSPSLAALYVTGFICNSCSTGRF